MGDKMSDILDYLLKVISGDGGTGAAFLLIAIGALVYERQRLLKVIDEKEAKIDKIMDDFIKGNFTLTQALTELKTVLAEIRGRLK
jgi:hypothetical protein